MMRSEFSSLSLTLMVMKKIISLALLALSFLVSVPAHADEPLKFGVKAGLNVSEFSFTSDVFDKTNQVGWFFEIHFTRCWIRHGCFCSL